MLNKQTIENGIRNIKANLGSLIDIDDVPFIIAAWQRNFKDWEAEEFERIIEHFIDEADNNTKFPRPYDLKMIYSRTIEWEKIAKKQQEDFENEREKSKPMSKEQKEEWDKIKDKILEPQTDGKI